jgi:hypothetical protein
MTILTASGTAWHAKPAPVAEEVEEKINKDLQTHFDPLLFIKWIPTVVFRQSTGEHEGRYALCGRYPQAHKVWDEVRQGTRSHEDTFEIFGWFTEHLHRPESEAKDPEQYLEVMKKFLGSFDNTRSDYFKRMQQVVEKNEEVVRKRKEEALDIAHDVALDQYYSGNRASRHSMYKGGKDK